MVQNHFGPIEGQGISPFTPSQFLSKFVCYFCPFQVRMVMKNVTNGGLKKLQKTILRKLVIFIE